MLAGDLRFLLKPNSKVVKHERLYSKEIMLIIINLINVAELILWSVHLACREKKHAKRVKIKQNVSKNCNSTQIRYFVKDCVIPCSITYSLADSIFYILKISIYILKFFPHNKIFLSFVIKCAVFILLFGWKWIWDKGDPSNSAHSVWGCYWHLPLVELHATAAEAILHPLASDFMRYCLQVYV